ncbi:hypothetical protein Tco_0037751 [Tanacetum coccineum]
MHQSWRTFVASINRCISGKTTGLDRLKELRTQILWGMYNKNNVDFVDLLWEDFMFQDDNKEISYACKEHMPYLRFTKVIINHFISKDKTISMRNMINLHIVHDDTLLGTLKKAIPKKARKFKKVASPLRKLYHVLEEEPAVKPMRVKKPAKKYSTVQTTCVVIRDTPSESVLKKKTPTKVNRGKGMDLLSDVALLEDAQLKKTLKKSKLETHKLHANSLGDGVVSQPKVSDEQEDKTIGIDKGIDENPNLNQNDDEEAENEEEYVRTPDSFEFSEDDEEYEELYKDVNVRLKDTENEEERKGDEEMTDVGHDDGTQQTIYGQVKDDEHVVLTTVHDTQKTEVPLQSSFVSFDFANQFMNLDNIPPTDTKFVSMMNVKVCHEEPSTQTQPLLNIPVTEEYIDLVEKSVKDIIKDEVKSQLPQILPKELVDYATHVIQSSITESLENINLSKSFSQTKSTYEVAASLTEFELKKILLDKIQKSKSYRGAQEYKDLYDALVKSYNLEKDLFESYGKVYLLKRDREDKDKDEDLSVGSDQGLKKRKISKDDEPPRGSKLKESKASSSKGAKSQPKLSGKSA